MAVVAHVESRRPLSGSVNNTMAPELSVIIPTYNRRESLVRTLDGLARQSLSPDLFEVVVVSDGSSDGTAEAVEKCSYSYMLKFENQENGGPSKARNRGAAIAKGEIFVFLDDDVEPVNVFLEEHLSAHKNCDRVVLIGPQSAPPGEHFPVWIAWEHAMLERQYVRFVSGEWEVGPNNLYSGNFSVRRRHFMATGGFDEAFRRQEDVELGVRLAGLNMMFQYCPKAIGYHRPVRSFKDWYGSPYLYGVRDVQMARDKGQALALLLARKHYNQRNMLTKLSARLCIGVPVMEPLCFGLLKPAVHIADRTGLRKLSLAICSLVFNMRYLQGMSRELGGPRSMWNGLRDEKVVG